MLGNGLARAERAGNACRTTLRDWEEGVQNPLPRDQGNVMPEAPHKWTRPANGPTLQHRYFFFLLTSFQSGDGFCYGVLTIRGDPGDCARIIGMKHNTMLKGFRLHGNAKDRAAVHLITNVYFGGVLPFFLAANWVKTCAAADK